MKDGGSGESIKGGHWWKIATCCLALDWRTLLKEPSNPGVTPYQWWGLVESGGSNFFWRKVFRFL